jgi:uncharacterized membrane protein
MRPDAGLLTVLILFLGIFLHLIPRLRKRNLYFGVTVAEEFRESEEGRAIARDFRVLTWAGTILAVAICQAALSRERRLLGNLTPQLQVAVGVVAWVRAWSRTRGHASQPTGVRSASLVGGQRASTGQVLALALPLLGPVGAAVYLWSRYSELPARYPVHWNAAGHVNRYVTKSPTAVFASPLIAVTSLLLVLAVALGICFASRRGSSGEQPGWASKFRRLNLAMLITIMWGASGLTTTVSVAPLLPAGVASWLMLGFVGALRVTVFAFAVPLVRMSMERTGGSDATPDSCWTGGAIYYNPDDPALMVERRDGIGYTINFGHRLSWALIALIVSIPILVVLFAAIQMNPR